MTADLPPESTPELRRRPVILLAEDRAELRRVLTRALTGYGFEVHASEDGLDGLAKAATLDRLDLLLTDLEMPRLGGRELARRLRLQWPALPVQYISGSLQPNPTRLGLDHQTQLLEKPFAPEELLAHIRRLLPEC